MSTNNNNELDSNGDINGNIHLDNIVQVPVQEESTKLLDGFTKTHWTIAVLATASLWFQVWESPIEKVKDEWRACNAVYADKCTYAGTRFNTNFVEMRVAEFIHGEVNLKELRNP